MNLQELDRIDRYLTLWAAWIRGHKPRLGFPAQSTGIVSGGSVQSFDDMIEQADDYAARTVDGLIQSLPPAQRCSIEVYHLGVVWRFPRHNCQELYEHAREHVERGLNRWGLV